MSFTVVKALVNMACIIATLGVLNAEVAVLCLRGDDPKQQPAQRPSGMALLWMAIAAVVCLLAGSVVRYSIAPPSQRQAWSRVVDMVKCAAFLGLRFTVSSLVGVLLFDATLDLGGRAYVAYLVVFAGGFLLEKLLRGVGSDAVDAFIAEGLRVLGRCCAATVVRNWPRRHRRYGCVAGFAAIVAWRLDFGGDAARDETLQYVLVACGLFVGVLLPQRLRDSTNR